MSIRCRALVSRVPASFLVFWICFCCFPEFILAAVVTLDSIQIFRTHQLITQPTVYFKCKDENMTVLPDVKEENVVYTFKGEESWQPLIEIGVRKCKRCGIYAMHTIKADDAFDEWEFCPSQFKTPNKTYTYWKDNEFNATFSCPQCLSLGRNVAPKDEEYDEYENDKEIHIAVLVASIAASLVVGTVLVVAIEKSVRNWQRKKRLEEQAKFLKLFEDSDDIEDELGLGTIV